jgi:hypothetical protein
MRLDTEAIYEAIYEQERSLISQFRGLNFDFNVIRRRGRSISEIGWLRRRSQARKRVAAIVLSTTNI